MTMVYAICAAVGGTILVGQFVMTLLGFGDFDVDGLDADVDGLDAGGLDGGDFDADAHAARGDLSDALDGNQHSDLPADQHFDSTWLFGVISFRTIIAALAFFGIAGLAGMSAQWSAGLTLAVAVGCGLSAMYLVHWMLLGLYRMREDGTARISRSVGCPGTVYLRIPAERSGAGKVTVNLGGRTVEYEAVTDGPQLATGEQIVVRSVVGGGVVEVAAAAPLETTEV